MTNAKPDQSQIAALIQQLEISSVELVSSAFELGLPSENVTPELVKLQISYELAAEMGANVISGTSLREIFCFVTAILNGTADVFRSPEKVDKDATVLSGRCKFAVRYRVNQSDVPNVELLSELSRTHAMFHAYPYIRACMSFQFAQMNIKGITLPLLKIGPKI